VTVDLGEGRPAELARRAMGRLFGTAHGVWLVTELCTVLHGGDDDRRPSHVKVHFVETRPPCAAEGVGCFTPAAPSAETYHVYVRTQDSAADPGNLVYGEYPGNPGCTVLILYRQPDSWMADSLYHELLHVWFLNAHQGKPRPYPTGHGDAGQCEFDEEFHTLLDAFSRELAAEEGRAPERLMPFLDTAGARLAPGRQR